MTRGAIFLATKLVPFLRAIVDPEAVGALTREQETLAGRSVLVVDPFDEATDGYWREEWGLKPSEQRVPGNRRLRRLWAAIPR